MSSAMVGNGYQQNYNTYNGQPAPNHAQNVIATGVLSYSDERHQKIQEILGSQRQKEYNQMLQKQDGYYEPHPSSRPPANEQQYYRSSPSQPQSVQTSPRRGVFYRLVSPEVGLPLGRYEEQRKSLDDQRQRDYFAMMSQKEKMEQQKQQEEKMKKQVHAQQLHMQQPEQRLYNYDEVQKNLREERRKDYGEFVKLKEEQSKIKPVPTPPGGLNVGQNDLYRQHLKDDLMKEYQASLKKQQKEKLQLQLAKAQQEFSSTPLGPAVLPLPVKPVELFDPEKARQQQQDVRKKDYNEILREKEQNPSPRKIPTPLHGLDIVSQSERTKQAKEKQRLYGQELQKEIIPDIHLESYRRNQFDDFRRGERNKEYNDFLSQKKVKAQSKREQLESLRRQPAVQPKYDNYASSDNHQRHRQQLDTELREQYQSFLSQNYSREPSHEYNRKAPEFGLPLDNKKSNELRRQQEKDRNQEYRSFLEEKKRSPRRYHPPTPEDKQGLPLTQRPYDEMKAINERQRNMEYNQFLAKSGLPFDKMSLQGSVQGSALARQVNDHHSETEPPTPQKRYPSKKHDREVTHRVEEEKKKKKGEVPRRQGDPSMDEKNMFSDMGKSQDAHKKQMNENAKKDYNNYVNHAFPEGLNRGEPTFAARKAPPDSWYDAQPPTHRRSPPQNYRPEPDNYRNNQMDYAKRLEQARLNEALYRKHDHQMNDHGHRQPPPRQEQAPYALY